MKFAILVLSCNGNWWRKYWCNSRINSWLCILFPLHVTSMFFENILQPSKSDYYKDFEWKIALRNTMLNEYASFPRSGCAGAPWRRSPVPASATFSAPSTPTRSPETRTLTDSIPRGWLRPGWTTTRDCFTCIGQSCRLVKDERREERGMRE